MPGGGGSTSLRRAMFSLPARICQLSSARGAFLDDLLVLFVLDLNIVDGQKGSQHSKANQYAWSCLPGTHVQITPICLRSLSCTTNSRSPPPAFTNDSWFCARIYSLLPHFCTIWRRSDHFAPDRRLGAHRCTLGAPCRREARLPPIPKSYETRKPILLPRQPLMLALPFKYHLATNKIATNQEEHLAV